MISKEGGIRSITHIHTMLNNSNRLIIDRFEGNWAVIEYNGDTFNLPKNLLPPHSKEGDVLDLNISVDECTTQKRRQTIKKLEDDLFK